MDLTVIQQAIVRSEPYSEMLQVVEERLPAMERNMEAFNKSSSQLKTVTLDVTDLTPISTARRLLATIQRTQLALEEAGIRYRKAKLKLDKIESRIESGKYDCLTSITIRRDKYATKLKHIEASARGAIRKITFLIKQHDGIMQALGVDAITEEMYEADQVRYHIMTAFSQALTAARSRGGTIDEGNHIYLFQLGINGMAAQQRVNDLLNKEAELLRDGKEPPHDMVVNWLNACADYYAEAPQRFTEARCLTTQDKNLLVDPNALS